MVTNYPAVLVLRRLWYTTVLNTDWSFGRLPAGYWGRFSATQNYGVPDCKKGTPDLFFPFFSHNLPPNFTSVPLKLRSDLVLYPPSRFVKTYEKVHFDIALDPEEMSPGENSYMWKECRRKRIPISVRPQLRSSRIARRSELFQIWNFIHFSAGKEVVTFRDISIPDVVPARSRDSLNKCLNSSVLCRNLPDKTTLASIFPSELFETVKEIAEKVYTKNNPFNGIEEVNKQNNPSKYRRPCPKKVDGGGEFPYMNLAWIIRIPLLRVYQGGEN